MPAKKITHGDSIKKRDSLYRRLMNFDKDRRAKGRRDLVQEAKVEAGEKVRGKIGTRKDIELDSMKHTVSGLQKRMTGSSTKVKENLANEIKKTNKNIESRRKK